VLDTRNQRKLKRGVGKKMEKDGKRYGNSGMRFDVIVKLEKYENRIKV